MVMFVGKLGTLGALVMVCACLGQGVRPLAAAETTSTMSAPMIAAPFHSSPIPVARPYEIRMPKLRWKAQSKGPMWTRSTMAAIVSHGQALIRTVPQDIDNWCPGYRSQDESGRAAFWAGLLSTLSYHESTWREGAVGGGGLWYGLVQIAPPTARWRNCNARSAEALKDGVANLNCAVRIMNVTVPRDQVVSRNMRGVAADWGPFHSAKKREDMRRWISRQPFCKPVLRASRLPVPRPGGIPGADVIPEGEVVPVVAPNLRPESALEALSPAVGDLNEAAPGAQVTGNLSAVTQPF